MIRKTKALELQEELSAAVSRTDELVRGELERHARLAKATWDFEQDETGGAMLRLALADPFGYASARFAPGELRSADFPGRLHRLVGDLLQSARRVHIPIKDATFDPAQLEQLRLAMNDPRIADGRPQLNSQVRLNSDGALVTRDFFVEADESVADAVKEIIQQAGFQINGQSLGDRADVQEAVRALVAAHLQDLDTPLRMAIWFRLDDPRDVHLLEVGDGVFDPGDGSLEGVSMGAGRSVPGARSVVIYLASPGEVHKAFEVNEGHPAIQAMRAHSCRVVFPEDGWQALVDEFPEVAEQTVG